MFDARDWLALGTFLVAFASLIFSVVVLRMQRNDQRFAGVQTQLAGRTGALETLLDERIETVDDQLKKFDMRFATLVAEIELFKARLLTVENDMKHLPDKDVTHRLEISLAKMENEMGKLAERMRPIGLMADRMQDALMEKVMSNA